MNTSGDRPAGEPLFERLEVINDPVPRSGPFNMAADEALLEKLGGAPVLRLYRWDAPTVSFGYFEPLAPVRAAHAGVALVRRWTGGGVVEHGKDFTYSLLVPRLHPFACLPVADTYRSIHGAVAAALAKLGCGTASLHGSERDVPSGERARACFLNPVRSDLMLGPRKVAGAAQRRTRRGLLHQGSVQGGAGFGGSALSNALAEALPGCLCPDPAPRLLRAEEVAAAMALAAAKYGSAAWLARC